MAEPFIAEIRLFAFDYAPRNWSTCDGQTLQIRQNQALFALIGSHFGGDGINTFVLPDLRGRVPVNPDNSTIEYAHPGGETQHTLTDAEMPMHSHAAVADDSNATAISPIVGEGGTWATSSNCNPFGATADTYLNPAAIASTGGGQAHNNMQPYLTINFCIALTGIFPSQS